jgi:hypothetical protein
MSQHAAKADGGNIGVLYCAELPVCAQVTTLATLTGKAEGVAVGYSTKVSASAPTTLRYARD